jgi:hypothetical protein
MPVAFGKAIYSAAGEFWHPFIFQASILSDILGANRGFESAAESEFSGGRR